MSLWSRISNVFRTERLHRDIDEELQSHIAEALREGRDPEEARRAFGSVLSHRESSRDVRLLPWLDSLCADAVFGWRQLLKRKVTSAAAILSLALAIGSCSAAFRLMDALLWRPLPVAAPERLYAISRELAGREGKDSTSDRCAYPMFRQMRRAVKDQADLIAVSTSGRIDITYGSDEETEKAYQQYVSGWIFQSFGIRAAVGRLLTENDDLTPRAHPYAVLSFEYWTRRFGADPAVVGRTFRAGNEFYQIVGVAEGPFTGTEPGIVTDIFVPTMMMKNNAIVRSDYEWFRTFVHLKPGVPLALVQEKLRPPFRAFLEERAAASAGVPEQEKNAYLNQALVLNSAAAGVSGLQQGYGKALLVLGVLVLLVLLISCANVANLMTAQAMARHREMALRVAIGAGRGRLVQLVVMECLWLALFAAVFGACFASWAAPVVAGMISTPDNPVRLILPADWRVVGFGAALALTCTLLFGLYPAFRASAVKPAFALRGGSAQLRPRMMQMLIASQVAFCVLVLFGAGLFLVTSERLTHQQTGFSQERLLTVETVTSQPQPYMVWNQVAAQLRTVPGVEAVALCEWPLMTGGVWDGLISVNKAPPSPVASYFLRVDPGWRKLMHIPLLAGRDFREDDFLSGAAVVNQAFARQYFGGRDPVGNSFDVVAVEGLRVPYRIVGLIGNTRYRDMREAMQPAAYFPFSGNYGRASFILRTSSQNPMTMATALRLAVQRARAGFRVSNLRTQTALVEQHLVRERLLSLLALFFGLVALVLAGVGLYGVLDYSVIQRRRELGIRIAIGAHSVDIAQCVIQDVFRAVAGGALLGLALGIISARFVEALLFEVKPTDLGALAPPAIIISAVALFAALPAIIRAVRIDPMAMLRSD
ncbi:ADOP family duplicated permease [Paludibaculum fermentans]|uniref:ABC transporter permease n=1 Tax=Paludibaculum fermentans TaxID=1473598 RepID=A0A7S7SK65_PALFE|nr:ADOP family duplicated permease [Paludibaculum fermentans]QOY87443.1 ABC transporter permease [Paludibaculum fermentans]